MSEVTQERLFEAPDDPIVERRALMFGFIAEETAGLDLTDEFDCITAVNTMLIAAEYHAQMIAEVKGDIDPHNQAFLSETLMERVNAHDCPPELEFDIDREWLDVDQADETVVARIEARAFAIAQVVVNEQRLANAVNTSERPVALNPDDIFFAEIARRDTVKQQRGFAIMNYVAKQVSQACDIVFGPTPRPDCRSLEWYEDGIDEDLFVREIEGLPPDDQERLAMQYFIDQGIITEEEQQKWQQQ